MSRLCDLAVRLKRAPGFDADLIVVFHGFYERVKHLNVTKFSWQEWVKIDQLDH